MTHKFDIPNTTNGGIYMLFNLRLRKTYIGQTKNFQQRAMYHLSRLRHNLHSNKELQADFNNGDEFMFVILEDFGDKCEHIDLQLIELEYMYAFRRKTMKLYNHETTTQIEQLLFWRVLFPVIDGIQKRLRSGFGCQLATLERYNETNLRNTLKRYAH